MTGSWSSRRRTPGITPRWRRSSGRRCRSSSSTSTTAASKARKAWSGDLLAKSVEDYHASYMSIHWWPREELAENRETVARINRRLGYRLQLRAMSWPEQADPRPAVHGRDGLGQRRSRPLLRRRLPGDHAQGREGRHRLGERRRVVRRRGASRLPLPAWHPSNAIRSRFTVAYRHRDPAGDHAPPTRPGDYSLFVSIGARDGTPRIALPLPDEDGHHRYKVGQIRLLAVKE